MKARPIGVFLTIVLLSSSSPVERAEASQLVNALAVEIQCTTTWPAATGASAYCFGLAHGAISGTDNYGSRYVGACTPSCPVEGWVTHQETCGALMNLPAITMLWGGMVIRSIATSLEEPADLTLPFAALSAGLYSPTVAVIAGRESGQGAATLNFRYGYRYSSDAAHGEGLGTVLPLQLPRDCSSPGPASIAVALSMVGI